MDDRNGEMFDHHAELFSQIGADPDHDALKEFLFESDGLLDLPGSILNKQDNVSVPQAWPSHCNTDVTNMCGISSNVLPPMFNHLPLDLPCEGNIPLENSLIDTLVKTLPTSSQNMIDRRHMQGYHQNQLIHPTNSLITHHNTDLLSDYNKPHIESSIFCRSNELDNLTWNGAIFNSMNNFNPITNYNLPQQRLNFVSSVDKNGNCSNSDKVYMTAKDNVREVPINNIHRLSPSASVESNVHTPTTSYDSVSPLSCNQTPVRSDESISPMGSSHTPLRADDCLSPAVKTPVKVEDSLSPNSNRTPLRLEESYSPGSLPTKSDSPRCLDDKIKCRSPSFEKESRINNKLVVVPHVSDVSERKKQIEHDPFVFDPESELKEVNVTLKREPKVCDRKDVLLSMDIKSPSALFNKSDTCVKNKISVPVVTAPRIDESLITVKKSNRTDLGSSSSESEQKRTSVDNSIVPEKRKTLSKQPEATKKVKSEFDNNKTKQCKSKTKTIYQSLISPEQNGIKLKIKVASLTEPKKKQRKRRSKGGGEDDCDTSDNISSGKKVKKSVRFSLNSSKDNKNVEQSCWGKDLPNEVLHRIFEFVVDDVGVVPSLVRFSSVCKQWNVVANQPDLWQTIDLSSPYIKQKCKIDRYFRWFLEYRLEKLQDLNLNGWKFTNITMILSLIGTHCTEIESIGLSGWQGLHCEHLKSLIQDCPLLSKLDLSDVSPESKSANSAVSQKSITFLSQTLGERLTQLILSNNTLSCLPLIISNLSAYCPNLEVLDLSNTRRVSNTEFALNIEQLQEGCPKLRVLRITNSNVTLATVPLEKQVVSPGFPALEELSIAGHTSTDSLRITSVMDDDGLERILKTSHKLRLLDVRGCTRVTDSSLVRLPAWDLEHLYLSGCSVTRQFGSGLELIAQKWCHSLIEIDLAWSSVSEDLDAAVMAFAEKGSESVLRILNLCGSSVSIEPVKAVLLKCTCLESINLQSCRGLPRGIKRLYENEQLIELRSMFEKTCDPEGVDEEHQQHHHLTTSTNKNEEVTEQHVVTDQCT